MSRRPDLELPGRNGKPSYLRRWWIWPRNRWFNAYWHRFGASDDARAVHDHPWWNVSIILRGRYREHFHDGTSRVRRAGHVVIRSALTLHRLELLTPTVTTLFLTGPRVRNWGFMTQEDGWIPHEDWEAYCNARAPTTAELRRFMDMVAASKGSTIKFRRHCPFQASESAQESD